VASDGGAAADSVVATPAPWRMLLVAQMMAHLGIHRSLNQRFGELFEQAVWADNLFGRFAGQ